jgi:AWS domain
VALEKLRPPPYTQLRRNLLVNRCRRPQAADDVHVCSCRPDALDGDADAPQACGDQCINRASHIECTPGRCPCGDACSNQRLQRGQGARTR